MSKKARQAGEDEGPRHAKGALELYTPRGANATQNEIPPREIIDECDTTHFLGPQRQPLSAPATTRCGRPAVWVLLLYPLPKERERDSRVERERSCYAPRKSRGAVAVQIPEIFGIVAVQPRLQIAVQ
eukprot:TRINITY_DN11549_c0_g1_i1.p2 TRINITY_DN11549_c0_g1~~TRINITY_DN11549_c0_g1_i1.p2  ORF type:complete len:128 (+),score=12.03 TRINITY_DN11549_c0_g1_i1:193-576(+)